MSKLSGVINSAQYHQVTKSEFMRMIEETYSDESGCIAVITTVESGESTDKTTQQSVVFTRIIQ